VWDERAGGGHSGYGVADVNACCVEVVGAVVEFAAAVGFLGRKVEEQRLARVGVAPWRVETGWHWGHLGLVWGTQGQWVPGRVHD
jgi:hypothetical protein